MTTKIAALLLAIGLVAAACGGDDEPELASADTSDTDASAADDAGDGSPDDGAADETAAEATDDNDDEPAMSGDSGSAWCDAIRSEPDSGPDFNLLGLSPDQIEVTFTSNVAAIERWEDMAPPEISNQVTTLADAFRSLVGQAEEANWDLAVLANDPDFFATFDAPEIGAAADDIDAYARDVCGVDLEAAIDDGASAPDASTAPAGDDLASQFLAEFGLPPGFLTPDQLECVNAELEVAFPDGVPADFTINNEEALTTFSDIGDACTLGLG